MMLEPVAAFRGRELVIRVAADGWELAAYHRLRRRIFCDEQRLFAGDDRDAIDARAIALVAAVRIAGVVDDIVGGVRLWQAEPGAWWGGRLAVCAGHRGTAGLASGLIERAVATACRRGARSFRATVQMCNVALFVRLGWSVIGPAWVAGSPHAVMAADLARSGGGAP